MLPEEYNRVSEVSKTEDDYIQDVATNQKPICYYVTKNGIVEEQYANFERTNPGMMYHLKPLFIMAKVDNTVINKVFIDGGRLSI